MQELNYRGDLAGTPSFFKRINEEEKLDDFASDLANNKYRNFINEVARKASNEGEKIWKELNNNPQLIAFIPEREQLLSFVKKIKELERYGDVGSYKTTEAIDYLNLSDSKTRLRSGASHSEIENAIRMFKNEDPAVKELLYNEKRDLYEDAELISKYLDRPSDFFPSDFGTDRYIERMEKEIFNNARRFSRCDSYVSIIKEDLTNVYKRIEEVVKDGVRNNDYIHDDNAKILKDAVSNLERLSVRSNYLDREIDKLMWYVGGSPSQIKEFQRLLNQQGFHWQTEKLDENGIYCKDTHASWIKYLYTLEASNVASIELVEMSVDIIEAGIEIGEIIFDNVYATREATDLMDKFGKAGKVIKIGKRILIVTNIVLDTIELGMAIYDDIKDVDSKFGTRTVPTLIRIGGKWGVGAIGSAFLGKLGKKAGVWAGAKMGASAGLSVGKKTLVIPKAGKIITGVFTAGGAIAGGIAGAHIGENIAAELVIAVINMNPTGSNMSEYILDITSVYDG